jgi:hypothetical protein
LVQNWPTVGRGKILATCRSELLAESQPITTSIEVPTFTVAESTEMIFKILSRKPAAADEVEATNRLSTKLGGLPLAVDIIAKQIRLWRRFRSVAEYLPYFEQNQRSALGRPKRGHRNPWYPKNLDNLWQTAFDGLGGDASELMGMLCFMAPESIPLSIFRGNDWAQQSQAQ